MSSKISLFNKAIFKSDLRRLWWVMALETFLIFMICVVPTMEDSYSYTDYLYTSTPFISAFAILTSALVFGYLHSAGPCTTLHSYPTTRSALFVTKTITGILFCTIPMIVIGVVLCALSFISDLTPWDVVTWVGANFCYIAVLFSLCTLVNMMTGNSVASVIFTLGFCLLPLIFIEANELVLRSELTGFIYKETNILSKIYISPTDIGNNNMGWLYILYSAIFIGAAYLLYRIRKLETNGEIIAFKWLIPVFIAIVSYLSAILGYFYIVEALHMGNIFSAIPFAGVGALVAYMVAKKSLNVKNALKPALIGALCCLVFVCAIYFDITGYETRLPDTDKIESVAVDTPYHYRNFYINENSNLTYTQRESIEAVQNLHKEIIRLKDTTHQYEELYICYKLKNSRTMERKYYIPSDLPDEYIKKLYNTDEFKRSSSRLFDTAPKSDESLTIYDRRLANAITLTPDTHFYKMLIEAMKADIMDLPGEYFVEPVQSSIYIIADWTVDENSVKGNPYFTEATFHVNDYTKRTMKVIDEGELLYNMPSAEEIEQIEIVQHNKTSGQYSDNSTKITDKEDIAKIYGLYNSMVMHEAQQMREGSLLLEFTFAFTLKNGHFFEVSPAYKGYEIPEELIEFVQ